jgi:hypothetical protein
MPVYTYQVVHADGSEGETFDVIRPMSDPPLERHPETGERVKRIYRPVNIAGAHSSGRSKQVLSNSNLERHGFTKYEKTQKGSYERTAGKEGPSRFSVSD